MKKHKAQHKPQGTKLKKGDILMASPLINDNTFKKSVVLLCEHSKEGSLGFILNKEMDIPLNDILADFPEMDLNVCFGGPVATDTLQYIHNVGDAIEGSVEVADGIYWGGDYEQLQFMVTSKLITEENIRFFVGYAGWEASQLDFEMKLSHGPSWVVADMKQEYFLHVEPKGMWQHCMAQKGDKYSILSEIPTGEGVWS